MIVIIQAADILKVDDQIASNFIMIRNNDINDVIAIRKGDISAMFLDPYKFSDPSCLRRLILHCGEREYDITLKPNAATILFEMFMSNIDDRSTAANPKIGFEKTE